MRSTIRLPTLRNVLRETHRSLAGLLLTGAMLAPVMEAAMGWPMHTPLGVPLLVHLTILAALGGVAFVMSDRTRARAAHRVTWVLVPPLAVVLAAILRVRANGFYTERALIEGMAVLCALQVSIVVLQGGSRRATPGVRLADVLSRAVGWILLASWVLIALEHRHPAGPLLILAGVAQVLALLALVPDALARIGWLGAGPATSGHRPESPVDSSSGGAMHRRRTSHLHPLRRHS